MVTLRNELERYGSLARSGGLDYFAELSTIRPAATSVRYYGEIVLEHPVRRRLVAAGQEVALLGLDHQPSTEEATDRAEQRIFRVATQQPVADAPTSPPSSNTWSQLEGQLGRRTVIIGVPTGLGELDKVTQGLQPSELVILAARPSVGKTSMALGIARNAAVLARQPVVIFSLEMSKTRSSSNCFAARPASAASF